MIRTEYLRRFVQLIVGSPWFDIPILYKLRNLAYGCLFETGSNCGFGRNCNFICPHEMPPGVLKFGNRVKVNHHVEIDYSGGVVVEDDVWISQDVLIETHTHIISKSNKAEWEIKRDLLVIEKDAWIGAKVIVLSSVRRIGAGAIVAAGAVVSKDVEPMSIVGGVPAVVISSRSAGSFDN